MVCASVNTQGGTAPAGLTEALLQRTGMALIVDEVSHRSPWVAGFIACRRAAFIEAMAQDSNL
jgi:hypothetical protein